MQLPPLRERVGDVELLAGYFLDLINDDGVGKPEAQHKHLSEGAVEVLKAHPWPGNIRELYHTLLRAVIWSTGAEISREDMQSALLPFVEVQGSERTFVPGDGFNLQHHLDQTAKAFIAQALRQSGHRSSTAAKMLGFASHQTLGNWMRRLGISNDSGGSGSGN